MGDGSWLFATQRIVATNSPRHKIFDSKTYSARIDRWQGQQSKATNVVTFFSVRVFAFTANRLALDVLKGFSVAAKAFHLSSGSRSRRLGVQFCAAYRTHSLTLPSV